jgi:hypothetical protein
MIMHSLRCAVALAVLALLLALTPASAQDNVLVPGDPPLTQKALDLYREMWEWYCDLKLTAPQRQQFQNLFVVRWKKTTQVNKRGDLSAFQTMEKEWRDVLKMKGAEQERKRIQNRDHWMKLLREWKDDWCRVLVGAYDAAYKPGGPKNPILVAGDPPLTRSIVGQRILMIEFVVDQALTETEWQEYERLYTQQWKKYDKAKKQDESKEIARNAEWVVSWPSVQRSFVRFVNQSRMVAGWSKAEPDTADHLVAEVYRASSKPGSPRNAILVSEEPPLTEIIVNRYSDYLEIMLGVTASGGFTPVERQELQNHLVTAWKKMKTVERQRLLADLQNWSDAAGKGGDEANKAVVAWRPKVPEQLQTVGDALGKWLVDIATREREKLASMNEVERKLHDAKMKLLENLRSSGHYEYRYNSATGRLDFRFVLP